LRRIVADDLTRVREFLRSYAEGAAGRLEPFRFGTVLLNDALPKVWDLNYLRVEGRATAEELAAEAKAVHTAAGHGHRKLLVEEEELAAELRPGLEALGFECAPEVVMVERRPPDRPSDTSVVREISADEVRPAKRREMAAEAWAVGDPEAVEQVLAGDELRPPGIRTRHFAAFVDGEIASWCDLYDDSRTAQVESVMTSAEHRNRGLARAVVTRAAAQARADGADLVFLVALADDWPKKLYGKLGFDVVGRLQWFQLTSQTQLQATIQRLLDATGASRVTLRRDVADQFFPVTHEALAPGAISIREARIDLRGQPVVQRLEDSGEQVVQDDCVAAYDNPDFHAMLEAYGGLRAQIVTPVVVDGHLVAIVSLHQCGRTRVWTPEEIALARETADRVRAIIRA
jgi:ribosomal protein S18 acetylase RimI-like enzyme